MIPELVRTVILGVVGYFLLQTTIWLIVFRWRYLPHLRRFFEDMPMMTASRYSAEVNREDIEFPTRDGLILRGSFLPALQPPTNSNNPSQVNGQLKTSPNHSIAENHTPETELDTAGPERTEPERTEPERTGPERASPTERVPRGVVVFCHELNGDRWNAVPYVGPLRREGFDVLTFDFRNHGQSDSSQGYQPMPWVTNHELRDLEAALDYLALQKPGVPVGLLGVSRGGCTVLCLAARRSAVRAVATDGAFPLMPTLLMALRKWMRVYTALAWFYQRVPNWLLAWHLEWAVLSAQVRHRFWFYRPESAASRVTQPTLMVHGGKDGFIPPEVASRLAQRVAGLQQFWVVPKAKHNRAILASQTDYGKVLVDFFVKHLGQPDDRADDQPDDQPADRSDRRSTQLNPSRPQATRDPAPEAGPTVSSQLTSTLHAQQPQRSAAPLVNGRKKSAGGISVHGSAQGLLLQ